MVNTIVSTHLDDYMSFVVQTLECIVNVFVKFDFCVKKNVCVRSVNFWTLSTNIRQKGKWEHKKQANMLESKFIFVS